MVAHSPALRPRRKPGASLHADAPPTEAAGNSQRRAGGSGEQFRDSPLQLDRDQTLPGDQGDWSGEMRHVGARGKMVKNAADMFKLGDSKNVAFPLYIQKWQDAQGSTQLVPDPGYLAVVNVDSVPSARTGASGSPKPGDAIVPPSNEPTPTSKARATTNAESGPGTYQP